MTSIKFLYPHVREKCSHSRNISMVDIAIHTYANIRIVGKKKSEKKTDSAYALLPPFTTSVGPSQAVCTV